VNYRFEIRTGRKDWTGNGQVFASRKDAEASALDLLSRWMLAEDYRLVETDEPANQDGPTLRGAGHKFQL
jgi:hypothetical protein